MNTLQTILPKETGFWLDRRLTTVYFNEFAYKAEPPATIEEWRQRRDFTRSQVALAAGLVPFPEKTPLAPRVWNHIRHEGTVIAKVRFESMPGLMVTGNLYMPERIQDQAPAILTPHGHWPRGRVHDCEDGSIPMRCLMLARLGFIVFSYDMIGYNDNNTLIHRWPTPIRKEAALYGASSFGLQTWNSIRALDFICSLPEVDSRRIGCTGASGGASQTWTLSILDERIKVIAPVCMLSSHFQGGCRCEEGPLLRINGITSFDILAACAPRPLILPAVTQDWTNLNQRYEVPMLRKVYQLFHAEDALRSFELDAPHNYNKETRERIYPWFTHWLLNQSLRDKITEDDLKCPNPALLLHTPETITPTEATTKEHLKTITQHLCASATPPIEAMQSPLSFRRERTNLVGEIVNNDQALQDVACRVTFSRWDIHDGKAQGCVLSRRDQGDVIPAIMVKPEVPQDGATTCLLLGGNGKSDFFQGGNYSTILDMLLKNGCRCLIPDLMGTGESANMPALARRDEDEPLFFAFNPSLYSMRVQDILTCLKFLQEDGARKITLVATGDSVKPALAALALSFPLHSAVLEMDAQMDTKDEWMTPLNYQPMIYKIGGMKGLAALANVKHLGLFKPQDDLKDYVSSYSNTLHTPAKLSLGLDTLLRLTEYVVKTTC